MLSYELRVNQKLLLHSFRVHHTTFLMRGVEFAVIKAFSSRFVGVCVWWEAPLPALHLPTFFCLLPPIRPMQCCCGTLTSTMWRRPNEFPTPRATHKEEFSTFFLFGSFSCDTHVWGGFKQNATRRRQIVRSRQNLAGLLFKIYFKCSDYLPGRSVIWWTIGNKFPEFNCQTSYFHDQ